jgi:hypothetical protein
VCTYAYVCVCVRVCVSMGAYTATCAVKRIFFYFQIDPDIDHPIFRVPHPRLA